MRLISCLRGIFLAGFIAVLLIAAQAQATDSCYIGGPLLPNYTLNGSATLNGEYILVTPDRGAQNASVFFNPSFSTSGDLHVKLVFQITTTVTSGADGVAFVMHSDSRGPSAIGQPGDGIGYASTPLGTGISPSVVVEFDTYNNSYFGDPNANHIAITRGGKSDHNARENAGLPIHDLQGTNIQLKSNKPIYAWIDYTASNTRLQVYLSDTDSRPSAPLLSTTAINLATELGPRFYMGFTGSTGGEQSEHKVLAFYASDQLSQPEQACCTSNADCASSPFGGVCDTVKHTCGQCLLSDTSQCVSQPSNCSLEGANNQCVPECDGNFGSNSQQACGQAFPVCLTSGPSKGSCSSCNGDNGSAATDRCGTGAPYCSSQGYCGFCSSNADCSDAGAAHPGPYCHRSTGQCSASSSCSEDADCGSAAWCDAQSRQCVRKTPNGQPVPGGICTAQQAERTCESGVCETADNRCGLANGTAMPAGGVAEQVCRSGVADADGRCGYGDGTGPCTAQDAGSVCRSGVCGSSGVCIPSGGCAVDADCEASATYCDTPSRACVPQLANDQPLPVVPGHVPTLDGSCSAQSAAVVCLSNACDADNRCGLANGTAMPEGGVAEQVCRSGVADADGRCGYGDGTGPCTVQDAGSVCRSGVCGSSGVCIPGGGCAVDADCEASATYCDTPSRACVPRLANDRPLLVVPGHVPALDGSCSAQSAAVVCLSNACDVDNRCGLLNGTQLPDGQEPGVACRSGIAEADGKCGLANGTAVPADSDPAIVCRSGNSTDGICGGPGSVGRIEGSGLGCHTGSAASASWVLLACLGALHGFRRGRKST